MIDHPDDVNGRPPGGPALLDFCCPSARRFAYLAGHPGTPAWQLGILISVALVSVALAGCGGKHGARVAGQVDLDGKLLAGGTVTFFPVGKGAAVYGVISADGRYQLSTGSESSLAPGRYRVTVVATENPPARPGETPPIGKLITPPRYGRLEQTDLEYEVQHGSNEIDIHLSS